MRDSGLEAPSPSWPSRTAFDAPYFDLGVVVPAVVGERDRLVRLVDAVDGDARYSLAAAAAAAAAVADVDVVEGLAVAVVEVERRPLVGEHRLDPKAVHV